MRFRYTSKVYTNHRWNGKCWDILNIDLKDLNFPFLPDILAMTGNACYVRWPHLKQQPQSQNISIKKPESMQKLIKWLKFLCWTGFNKCVWIGVQICVCCLGFRRTQLYPGISRSGHWEQFYKTRLGHS